MNRKLRQYGKMLVQNVLLPVVYRIQCASDIQKGLVLFADAHNSSVPSSMAPLVEAVRQRGNMQVMEIYDDYQNISFKRLLSRMLYFMKYYARAEYVVICDNFLPVSSCRKRPGTTVIQLWHGCGAFKKFGYDTEGDIPSYYKGNVYRNYDIVTVSAPGCAPHFQSAMRLKKEVFRPLGVCRTDKYLDPAYKEACRQRFLEQYPQAAGKKIVLWAPTFRGSPAEPELEQYGDIVKLGKQLPEEIWLIIKVHPHLAKKYPYDNCALPTDGLLPVTDLLITDYSSIIFEYCIYKKPMLFYAPDMDEYGVDRGFYLDYESLPGKIVRRQEELPDAVLYALSHSEEQAGAVGAFYDRYMSGCDGNVTQRLADMVCGEKRKSPTDKTQGEKRPAGKAQAEKEQGGEAGSGKEFHYGRQKKCIRCDTGGRHGGAHGKCGKTKAVYGDWRHADPDSGTGKICDPSGF